MARRTFVSVCLLSLSPTVASMPQGPGASRLDDAAREQGVSTAQYRVLDNVEGPWVNLNTGAVRPLAAVPRADAFYVVNSHDSTVEYFDGMTTSGPQAVYPVPWGPVAIAYWDRDPAPDELLVLTRGSYTLARVSVATGEILHLLELRAPSGEVQAEPGDLLLDAAGRRAFISCSASDSVVQVDLDTDTITRVYSEKNGDALRCKNPLFLSFDPEGRILVAPLTSGNGTIPRPDEGPGVVADISSWYEHLPDEDLFRIDPDAPGGVVEVVARSTGAVLFAQETNPRSGLVWQLGTEALNADPERQTEAALRGSFIRNQLTIASPDAANPSETHLIVDLDALAAGNPMETLGQPYALAFMRQGANLGTGLVAGLLTDNVVAINFAGTAVVGAWQLEEGSIPRGLLLQDDESHAYVHCWGTNRVARIDLSASGTPVVYFDLRHDPTPEDVREGRALFYDGHNSAGQNAGCASCHVDGGSDLLSWNLSDNPGDNKGPMVTQRLSSLERVGRLHWRGEQRMEDFNAAFESLLGGTQLATGPGSAFEKLAAYIFSLESPANPNQSRERLLDDRIVPPGVVTHSATRGQDDFFETKTFRAYGDGYTGYSCVECHSLPTGSIGDTFVLAWANFPRRGQRKIAPLTGLWRKAQTSVPVREHASNAPRPTAFLGVGMSHNGTIRDVRTFIEGVGPVDPVEVEDSITAFVHQMDEGLAPAVHEAYLLDAQAANRGRVPGQISRHLIRQAGLGYCDIVVFGRVDLGSGPAPFRWLYRKGSDRFVADQAGVAPRPFEFFLEQATKGARNVFVGLPFGMGRRFGIDHDMDGILNQDDVGMEYVPDPAVESVAPVFVRSPKLLWANGRAARVAWTTNEPTTSQVDYSGPSGDVGTAGGNRYSCVHSALLTDLIPSAAIDPLDPTVPLPSPAAYTVDVTVFDRNGNSSTAPLVGGITPLAFLRDKIFESLDPDGPLIEDLETEQALAVDAVEWLVADDTSTPGTLHASAQVHVVYKDGGPPTIPAAKRAVVASVLVHRAGEPERSVSTDFTAGVECYRFDAVETRDGLAHSLLTGTGGPYLISFESDADGYTEIDFDQPGLNPGDRILLVVEGVTAVDPEEIEQFRENLWREEGTLHIPVVSARYAWTRWSFPDSDAVLATCYQGPCD